jgi:hypothetical protein
MLEINLAPIPYQSLSVNIDSIRYDLRIFLATNVMCCDLAINGIPVLTSTRLIAGGFIIPYRYLENGNFLITTLNDELPYYEQFGTTQFLTYLTQDELENIRYG